MNIQDLEGCTVKLGATSITAKKDNGKTVGIVTQVRRFTNAPSRIKFDFAKAARPALVYNRSFKKPFTFYREHTPEEAIKILYAELNLIQPEHT